MQFRHGFRFAFMSAIDEALDRGADVLDQPGRFRLRRRLQQLRSEGMYAAAAEFAEANGYHFDADAEGTPLLDFWQWVIESGKVQAFMRFLVTEFLPALIQIIMPLLALA